MLVQGKAEIVSTLAMLRAAADAQGLDFAKLVDESEPPRPRPLVGTTVDEMERMFEDYADSREGLLTLRHELSKRTTFKAGKLYKRVEAELAKMGVVG